MYRWCLISFDIGGDVESQDAQGFTPVFTAVEHGHLPILELLIQCGCNLHDNQNWSQRSLLMSATKRGRPECLRLLLHSGSSLKLKYDKVFPIHNGVIPHDILTVYF